MTWRVGPKAALGVACALAAAWPASSGWAKRRHLAPAPAVGRRLACEAFVASATQRVARAGDTLWSLTAEVTGKPWVWPQIWALNPEMTNPHWLLVGQQVHFVARPHRLGGPASSRAASGPATAVFTDSAGPGSPSQAQPEPAPGGPEAAPGAGANAHGGGARPRALVPTPSSSSSIALVPSAPLRHPPLLPAAWFARDELKQMPTLMSSSGAGLLYVEGARVKIDWPAGGERTPGRWAIVRITEGAQSGALRSDGGVATATGIVDVSASEHNTWGRIEFVREEVEAGQRLVPIEQMTALAPMPRALPSSVCGTVTAFEHGAMAGSPYHVALLDRGELDGVVLGGVLQGTDVDAAGGQAPLFLVVRLMPHAASLQPLRAHQEFARGLKLCGAESPSS